MKKLAVCLLLLIYFTVTTGFVVSVHYCMNRIDSVEIGYHGNDECGKCGMVIEKNDGCCKDDVTVVKLATDHNLAKVALPDFTSAAIQPNHAHYFLMSAPRLIEPFVKLVISPPPACNDKYLLHCVFRL